MTPYCLFGLGGHLFYEILIIRPSLRDSPLEMSLKTCLILAKGLLNHVDTPKRAYAASEPLMPIKRAVAAKANPEPVHGASIIPESSFIGSSSVQSGTGG